MDKQRETKGISWKKTTLIVVICVLLLLLIVAVGVVIWADSLLDEIDRIPTEESTYSEEQLESITGELEVVEKDPVVEQAEKILSSKNVINILLVGQDRREGEERQR